VMILPEALFLGHWPANTRTGTHKNTGLHALGGRGIAAGRGRLHPRCVSHPSWTAPGTGGRSRTIAWVHEIKHDGFRLMVRREGSRVRLFTRGGTGPSGFPASLLSSSLMPGIRRRSAAHIAATGGD
jgi:hypothetical protein